MRHVKCSDSVKAIYLDKEAIFKTLKDVSEELGEKLPYVKNVMLFGSLAKGEEHGLSDVDLLVIVEDINRENFWKIYGEAFEIVSDYLNIDFDLIVMSESDFLSDPYRLGPTISIKRLNR